MNCEVRGIEGNKWIKNSLILVRKENLDYIFFYINI